MENKEKETVSLKSALVGYLRRWKLFLAVFIISFIPAILYLTFYPRTYEFLIGVKFQDEKESGMGSFALGEAAGLMKSFGIGTGGGGSLNIDDEVATLTSNRMLSLMILDLGINVSYTKPYSFYNMYREAPLKLTADSLTIRNLNDRYVFNVSVAPGAVKVKASGRLGGLNETFVYESLPANIKMGSDEFILDFNPDSHVAGESFRLKIRCQPASWLAEYLEESIEIEEVSNSSNVVLLTCSDHSVERGKDMLNTLVSKYNKDMESYKQMEENKTLEFVNGRIVNILDDLAKTEMEIQAYKTKNEMTLLESDVLLYTETLKELQTSIVDVEAQSRLVDMLDEYIKDPVNKDNVIPSLFSAAKGEQGGAGGAIENYNEAIILRDRLLRNSNETNPMYINANSQVEKLREGVYVMIENARKGVNITLDGLKAKENALFSKMKTIPEKEREYRELSRNQEILQGMYLVLLQKREETVLSLSKQMDRARVIQPAFVKKKPLGPRKLYAAIGILVLTIVIPVGYLFVKDLFVSIKEEYKNTKE
ncbi:MAG: tyrosine protein kinase [Tannerella sp.]|jgi:uncharacterized protein involved in exopolysaccharide biosynthesis|nr:tyrosine protein kinase [Tannerella sp.]